MSASPPFGRRLAGLRALTRGIALASAVVGLTASPLRADVRLPRILSDGVVLQRERIVSIFGFADPGEEVRVTASWGERADVAYADATGTWSTYLRTPAAGGPHTLEVVGRNRLVVRDVWSGEVWLCSGQSNMEMPLAPVAERYGGVHDWEREVADSAVSGLHFFTVENRASAAPTDDVESGGWRAAGPTTSASFSATAYFAGRKLARELGVPVGLVAADWGGTPIESWTSGVTLSQNDEFAAEIARLERDARAPGAALAARTRTLEAWLDEIEEVDHGLLDGHARLDFDDSSWSTVEVPGALAGDLARHDGVVWMRRTFEVTSERAASSELATSESATLELGAIDDFDVVFVDGERVGATWDEGAWSRPRTYTLRRPLAAGRHVVSVRVLDTGGAAGIVSSTDARAPRTPRCRVGGMEIELGGTWRARAGAPLDRLPRRPPTNEVGAWTPSALYNGMIAPLTRFSFRGVFWYQGESNRARAWSYVSDFPAFVRDWRARFGDEALAFHYVQIAPYRYADDRGEAGELREAQRRAQDLPGVGMVVTTDVGEVDDIHPRDKRTVGERLGTSALARTYGRAVEASGPVPRSFERLPATGDGRVRLALVFDHADGLRLVDGSTSRFELGDASGRFAPADAVVDGTRVELTARSLGEPVRVRMGQGATDDALLVNAASWPASPFRLRLEGDRLVDDDEAWVTRRATTRARWRRSDDVFTLRGPITRWDEGVPLGNGLLGALVWGEPGVLRFSLDRTDLWDLRRPAEFSRPDWTWRTLQRLVASGDSTAIRARFDAPYDEVPYPTKLPLARLELPLGGAQPNSFALDVRQGEVRVALSRGSVRAFVSAARPLVVLRVEGVDVPRAWKASEWFVHGAAEPLGFGVALEHDGERSTGLEFAGPGAVRYAVAAVGVERANGLEIALTVVAGAQSSAPLEAALEGARTAATIGYGPLLGESMSVFHAVRGASRVRTGEANLDAQYDIAAHLLASGSRQGAPPLALQGPWTQDGGLPPWKGDYHNDLNTQTTYVSYPTAGMFTSGSAFFDHYARCLPRFREFAREFYGVEGAVVPGVMGLDGAPLSGWCMYSLSPTNGGWIAEMFARHWRYTGDEMFLREQALPFVTEVADALLALAPREAGGRRRLPLSSSPEIHDDSPRAWLAPNSNYDLAMLRAAFGSAASLSRAAGQAERAETYEKALQELEEFDVDEVGALTFARSEPYAESHRHFSHAVAIHPLGQLSVEGSARERDTVNATLDGIAARGTSAWCGYSFAWYSALAARAGRPETARRSLVDFERAFTLSNGFHANGDQSGTGLSNFTYRPVTLEGNFLAMEALHEMLLQSHGGVVRVFPAASRTWPEASFERLWAEGGFVVSARRSDGRTAEVRVESTRGGRLRLRDPFEGGDVEWNRTGVVRDGGDWVVDLPRGEELAGSLRAGSPREVRPGGH